MLNITHALFVLQPILYSYFRSSCSWRVRTGEGKECLSGALLDRFKTDSIQSSSNYPLVKIICQKSTHSTVTS